MHHFYPVGGEPVLVAGTILVENRGERRGQRRGWCCAPLALPPPGVLVLTVPTPLSLSGSGRPRALLRVLLLGVSSMLSFLQPSQLVQGVRVGIPHHRELHPLFMQVFREIPHELANPGLPEKLLRMFLVDTPIEGEVNGPLPIVPVIYDHQFPECQAPLGRLGPDVFSAEALIWQIQPGGLRHLAVGDLRHVV